jgi:VanZ family protein
MTSLHPHCRNVLVWLPALSSALLIFLQSFVPSETRSWLIRLMHDKLLHFGLYFIFGLSLAFSLRMQIHVAYLREHWFVSGMLIATLYAIGDETHQLFLAKRTADIADLNADVFGIFLAFFLFRFVAARWEARKTAS